MTPEGYIRCIHPYTLFEPLLVCLFVCLTGRPCGTCLGPGGPDLSKSSSQAKKPILKHAGYEIMTDKNRLKKRSS